MSQAFETQAEWVHLQYEERAAFTETYGFSGNQGAVNLEGIRFRPEGRDSGTLMNHMTNFAMSAVDIDRDMGLSARELMKPQVAGRSDMRVMSLHDRKKLAQRLESYRRAARPLVACASH